MDIASTQDNDGRKKLIQELVEDVAQRRAAGEEITDDQVIAQHPDLMPELEQKLKDLDAIAVALRVPSSAKDNPASARETPTLRSTVSGHSFPSASEDDQDPDRIDRYEIRGRLGRGGFGTVYRGYDAELQREVAIKVPRPDRIRTPADLEAYLNEARLVAQLDHPNIVPVYDTGQTEDGGCFVVSKLISGSNLRTKIKQPTRDYREVASLVATIADALHYAHSRGITHRDIKPENILIDDAAKPHVTDFGLAITDEDFGKGSGYAGTPLYWSPEQARGEGQRIDGRSDIFSLGIVFYELLTGRKPFTGSSPSEIAGSIRTVEVRPLRMIDDMIPKELERICLKSLEKRARHRYQTAQDLSNDLRAYLTRASRANVLTRALATALRMPGQLKLTVCLNRCYDRWNANRNTSQLPSVLDWFYLSMFCRRRSWSAAQSAMMHSATKYHVPRLCLSITILIIAVLFLIVRQAHVIVETHGRLIPTVCRDVAAQTDGIVKEVFSEFGAYVHQGEILVVIENTNLQSELKRVQALLRRCSELLDEDRVQMTEAKNGGTLSTIRHFEAEIAHLENQIVELTEQEKVLLEQYSYRNILSPLDGVIYRWKFKDSWLGKKVTAGDVLTQVIDTSGPWEIQAQIPLHSFEIVRRAQQRLNKDLHVLFRALRSPGDEFQGLLPAVAISNALTAAKGSYVALPITFDQILLTDLEGLRPGTEVNVGIVIDRRSLLSVHFASIIRLVALGIVVFIVVKLFCFPLLRIVRAHVSLRRMAAIGFICSITFLLVLFVPFPQFVDAPVLFELRGAVEVQAIEDGVIRNILVSPGDYVHRGDNLAILTRAIDKLEITSTMRALTQQRRRLDQLIDARKTNPEAVLEFPDVEFEIGRLEQVMDEYDLEKEEQRLIAPFNGYVVPVDGGPLNSTSASRLMNAGATFCYIGDLSKLNAILAIRQEDVEFIECGQHVEINSDAWPDVYITGSIADISPDKTRAGLYEAIVPCENQNRFIILGTKGKANVKTGWRSLWARHHLDDWIQEVLILRKF